MPQPLHEIIRQFTQHTGYRLRTAAEIEFYLTGDQEAKDPDCLAAMLLASARARIGIHGMEHEDGVRQYEISLLPHDDPLHTVKEINQLRTIIRQVAADYGNTALIEGKPFADQPGCGLHVHISLHDHQGYNVLVKPEPYGEQESDVMRYAVAGLLATMKDYMDVFAPQEADKARFTTLEDRHAPSYICWGGNNRTAAIRIPTSTLHPEKRHIEHRVACVNADALQVMLVLIGGIRKGLEEKIEPPEKLYGNAFDPAYGLEPLVG